MTEFKIKSIHLGHEGGRNFNGEKELLSEYRWIALNPDHKRIASLYPDRPEYRAANRFTSPIVVRSWMGRSSGASTVYATVWIRSRAGEHSSGAGRARGYGYHKESAAIYSAFRAAGVEFTKSWAGTGQRSIERAVTLVGFRIGYRAGGLV